MLQLGFLEAENRASGFLAVLTAVGVCGWKIWQGGNFTEEYALPWITAAALVFFRFFQSGCYRLREIFLLGFSFAIVFLLRANMVAVWVALLPPVLICFLREKRFPDVGKCLGLFLLGAAAVFFPVLLWAGKTGCLSALWEDYILFNFSYTGNAAAQENSILKTALQFAAVVWPGADLFVFRPQEQPTVVEHPVFCFFTAGSGDECTGLLSLRHHSAPGHDPSADRVLRSVRTAMVPTVQKTRDG